MGIAAGDRQTKNGFRKNDFIGIAPEIDFTSQERVEFRRRAFSRMPETDAKRRQPAIGYFPANPDQRHHPEFDLMAIGIPINIGVLNFDNRVAILPNFQANAFIGNCAVPLGVAKSLRERFR